MTHPNPAEMYRALLNKDASYEGIFYAAIKTTGIFCRPSCRARKPKRENVEFFTTTKEALQSGYRPCKICNPLEQPDQTPGYIRKVILDIENNPGQKLRDGDLRARGIEPSRIRRWFLKHHGMTFHTYQRLYRINSAFKKIQNGESVTRTAYDTGYESLSGFTDSFKSVFGVSPKNSREKRIIDVARIETPLGTMFACAVEEGLCLLEFTDRRMLETELKQLARGLNAEIIQGFNYHIETVRGQINEYFIGKRRKFTLPLFTPGTPFQRSVWDVLTTIPYAQTISYQQQAEMIGKPKAVRAVANANGMNRIAIIIPCHRVIGADGTLTGYGGGLWRKRWLLEHEKKHV
jgi:AraC family transcriptional regulator, regulatory protein of adaptative response / methylated-DNA-[protein]-cysteine methyltransferase